MPLVTCSKNDRRKNGKQTVWCWSCVVEMTEGQTWCWSCVVEMFCVSRYACPELCNVSLPQYDTLSISEEYFFFT